MLRSLFLSVSSTMTGGWLSLPLVMEGLPIYPWHW